MDHIDDTETDAPIVPLVNDTGAPGTTEPRRHLRDLRARIERSERTTGTR